MSQSIPQPPTLPEKTEADLAKSLSTAATLLLLKSMLLLLPCLVLFLLDWKSIDSVGRTMLSVVAGVGLYVLVAALLLNKRKKIGRVLAWTILPFFLLGVPIGTILSIFTIVKMEESKGLLK